MQQKEYIVEIRNSRLMLWVVLPLAAKPHLPWLAKLFANYPITKMYSNGKLIHTVSINSLKKTQSHDKI